MGWETALGTISSRGKTAPGLGDAGRKTTEKEPGMGSTDLVTTAGTIPPGPGVQELCSRARKAPAWLLEHCQVSMAGRSTHFPSLCLKQQRWQLGAAQPLCQCQVFVFLGFQPRVRWGRGNSRALGLLQHCCTVEGVFGVTGVKVMLFDAFQKSDFP